MNLKNLISMINLIYMVIFLHLNRNSSAIKEGLPTLERRNNKTTITNFDEENKFLAWIQEKKPFTFKQNSHCESK